VSVFASLLRFIDKEKENLYEKRGRWQVRCGIKRYCHRRYLMRNFRVYARITAHLYLSYGFAYTFYVSVTDQKPDAYIAVALILVIGCICLLVASRCPKCHKIGISIYPLAERERRCKKCGHNLGVVWKYFVKRNHYRRRYSMKNRITRLFSIIFASLYL